MNNKPRLWCPFCPVCQDRLYTRKDGFVCRNHRCPLYHKMGLGWMLSLHGWWFFQDTRAFKDIKNGITPDIDRHRILVGAHVLSLSKLNDNEVMLE